MNLFLDAVWQPETTKEGGASAKAKHKLQNSRYVLET